MAVRLGFAVAIQVDADILLIDEVLAVGDAAFQQKCFEQFETLKAAGKTIIFVTHDMSAIEHFCDRAMLLERGELVAIGAPGDVARKYNQLNFGRVVHTEAEGEREGDRVAAEITAAWFEDSAARAPDGDAAGRVLPRVRGDHLPRGHAGPDLRLGPAQRERPRGDELDDLLPPPAHRPLQGGRDVVARTGFALRIAGNRYTLSPSIAHRGSGGDIVDVREDLVTLLVHSSRITGGVVDLEQSFEILR